MISIEIIEICAVRFHHDDCFRLYRHTEHSAFSRHNSFGWKNVECHQRNRCCYSNDSNWINIWCLVHYGFQNKWVNAIPSKKCISPSKTFSFSAVLLYSIIVRAVAQSTNCYVEYSSLIRTHVCTEHCRLLEYLFTLWFIRAVSIGLYDYNQITIINRLIKLFTFDSNFSRHI